MTHDTQYPSQQAPEPKYKRLSDIEEGLILRGIREGKSLRTIAKELDRDVGTISRATKRGNLKKRLAKRAENQRGYAKTKQSEAAQVQAARDAERNRREPEPSGGADGKLLRPFAWGPLRAGPWGPNVLDQYAPYVPISDTDKAKELDATDAAQERAAAFALAGWPEGGWVVFTRPDGSTYQAQEDEGAELIAAGATPDSAHDAIVRRFIADPEAFDAQVIRAYAQRHRLLRENTDAERRAAAAFRKRHGL